MKFQFLIMFVCAISVIGFSCRLSGTEKTSTSKIVNQKKLSAIEKLSVDLSNTLGFKLISEDGNAVVDSIASNSPAYLAGLRNGFLVESLSGVEMATLDDSGIEKIRQSIFRGALIARVIQDVSDKNHIDITIHYGKDNCPQESSNLFWFVSTPQENKAPTILSIQLFSIIESVSFKRTMSFRVILFDCLMNKWHIYDELMNPFAPSIDPSNFSEMVKQYIIFSSDPNYENGYFKFDREFSFVFNFSMRKVRDNPDAVYVGNGILKINETEIKGYVLSRHSVRRFTMPFVDENKLVVKRDLTSQTRHIEDRISDWLILFDSNGNALELNIESQQKKWWGIIYPNTMSEEGISTCFGKKTEGFFENFDMIWFDGFLEGKEAEPYPSQIKLRLSGESIIEISLEGIQPLYKNNDSMIYLSIVGNCLGAGISQNKVFGYLFRVVFL